jgi:hypothetical protein
MTAKKDLKRRVRERQAQTGESYVTARRHVVAQAPDPVRPGAEPPPAPPPADPAEPRRPVIHVDEMHDITEAAAQLGWRCRVTITRSLLDLAEASHVLDKIRVLLDATANDPAMERFRTVLLHGERVSLPKIPRGFWMEQMRRFLARAHAGIGGISEQGDCLALVIDGTMVLAHIGYWPRPPRAHAAPRLSLSAIGPATEGLDSMSVLFS